VSESDASNTPTPVNDREKLLGRLRADDHAFWSIIRELALTSEPERRRILRPHEESGFTGQQDDLTASDQRSRLDSVLGVLILFELGCETGLLTHPDIPLEQTAELFTLFGSEAFLRYSNAYLYFGIRFLSGRLNPPAWMTGAAHDQPPRHTNERPIALATPPKIRNQDGAGAAMVSFLDLPPTAETDDALRFLDGFVNDDEEPDWFELWLRGVRPETEMATANRFTRISHGLSQWALNRSSFYLGLQPPAVIAPVTGAEIQESYKGRRPKGGWAVTNPVAARFGLADIYWIAKLLRADVSADAKVTYKRTSWLQLLSCQVPIAGGSKESLLQAEEVLRAVFDFTCDLIQNALEITANAEQRAFQPELFVKLPATTIGWREAFDEESDEIESQRRQRKFVTPTAPTSQSANPHPGGARPGDTQAGDTQTDDTEETGKGWSKRIRTGEHPRNLIGLAFSGGGIRSATFNLGVLQGLQEFDLLRSIDYLSTVSGGGFIGSWLMANVRRTAHWLGRLTEWDESIAHLRRYSRYLAPANGILSADTWTMWFSWLRNAFFIQITGVACLTALFAGALTLHKVFLAAAGLPSSLLGPAPALLSAAMAILVTWTIFFSLRWTRGTKRIPALSARSVRWLGVMPTWIGSFIMGSLLWGEAVRRVPSLRTVANAMDYSTILAGAWRPWWYVLVLTWLGLAGLALVTTSRHRWNAVWIAALSTAALYLELCGIMWLFLRWASFQVQFSWYAFVFGPAFVLAANSLSAVLFIGLCGRNSSEWIREWWTRFGSWLAMFGTVFLAIGVAAVFGPWWILLLFKMHWAAGSAVTGWVGTVASGLLAGKSSRTSGTDGTSPKLELLAKAAGFLFIAGAMLAVATLLYVLLVNIGTDDVISSDSYWPTLQCIHILTMAEALGVTVFLGALFSWYFEINIFGLNHFYRNRLVRCYLGATRWAPGFRKPQPFTGFDRDDDLSLSKLRGDFRGPFPILNCSLNLGGSSDLALHTRHSASFSLTPFRCGSDRPRIGYAPTRDGENAFAGGVMLGQAVAVSGAAASPNQGYNTSPLVAFLLTMFNVRLGWWFPNPGRLWWGSRGLRSSLLYLVEELFGIADETRAFVNVSDGGHFENLGIYELVRRRCRVIIASDAECDDQLRFGSLGNVVRICETDFGAKIEIDVSSIRPQPNGYSLAHCTVGKITYSNGSIGWLIYLKASVTSDEDVGVAQYRSIHPNFPHETTADQFFTEDQFESYRRLGQHIVRHAMRGIPPGTYPDEIAEKLYDVWAPMRFGDSSFLRDSERLDAIWERFRQSKELHPFLTELTGGAAGAARTPSAEELSVGLELIQLMEDAFLDLRLDDFWEHPDNRGWAMLFTEWARSPLFRAIWVQTRRTFGIRFEYFCEQRLGLPRGRPITRV
jgi:Patatin-like phospholipase